MQLQYFSDIHLEFGPLAIAAREADVVVAAGDIGPGTDGARWLMQLGRPVVYVAGNHEFYGGDLNAVRTGIARLTAGSQVHFLDNAAVCIGGVRFLGTTLWTDFDDADPALMAAADFELNDYAHIFNGVRLFNPEHALSQHRQARAWLAQELATPYAGPTVVVSHHAPSLSSWRAPANRVRQHAYCNRLDAMVRGAPIAAWIHGHVHWCLDYRLGATRVLCNPRGYHGRQRVAGFDPGRNIRIDAVDACAAG
ncbi:MAG: metallophosphoesterase [Gammaproteobacteria bacterium]